MMVGTLRIIFVLAMTLFISGCVTEQLTGPKSKADPEKYLQALIDLGVGYLRNGDYQRSKEKLMLALEQDSRSPTAHTTLGMLYQMQREYKSAERHFKKAIRYDSDLSQARMNYGAFLFQQKRYEEAVEQLAIAADDNSYRRQPEAVENLGVCYLRLKNYKLAEENFLRALSLNARLKRALIEMAELRFSELKYVESNSYYRGFLNASPQTARSLWLGVRLARIYGKRDEESNYAMLLETVFPTSKEYKMYKEGVR